MSTKTTKPSKNHSKPKVTRRKVDLFGVPMDLGGARRGTDMGPSALRIAGLEEKLELLGFDVQDGETSTSSLARRAGSATPTPATPA